MCLYCITREHELHIFISNITIKSVHVVLAKLSTTIWAQRWNCLQIIAASLWMKSSFRRRALTGNLNVPNVSIGLRNGLYGDRCYIATSSSSVMHRCIVNDHGRILDIQVVQKISKLIKKSIVWIVRTTFFTEVDKLLINFQNIIFCKVLKRTYEFWFEPESNRADHIFYSYVTRHGKIIIAFKLV